MQKPKIRAACGFWAERYCDAKFSPAVLREPKFHIFFGEIFQGVSLRKKFERLDVVKSTVNTEIQDEVKQSGLKRVEYIAKFFDRSVRRIQQLTQEGILPTVKGADGKRYYDLVMTIKRYIEYLQEQLEKKKNPLEEKEKIRLDAEISLKQAKATTAQLELDELKGEMHRSEDVQGFLEEFAAYIRSMLLSLPGLLAIDLSELDNPAEISDRIEDEVNRILTHLSEYTYDPSYFKKRVRERAGWRKDEESSD